jgi:hypothetical protein
MRLIAVHSPQSESEALVIVGMLEAYEIPLFVHGRHTASLIPCPSINGYNTQTIMVPEVFVEDALALLSEFHNVPSDYDATSLTSTDRLRVFFEWLFCGWHVPFRKESGFSLKADISPKDLDGP